MADQLRDMLNQRDRKPARQDPAPLDDLDNDPADELDDEPENDDPDGDPDGDPADDTDEWTPPSREEWEAQQAKLRRAREQAKKLREAKNGKPKADNEAAVDNEKLERWQTRAVRSEARSALLERGADAELLDLALAKLKLSEVEFDEDDDPILDDWLDEMEEKYPKLFGPPAGNSGGRAAAGQATTTSRRPAGAGVDQGAATNAANGAAKPPRRMWDQLMDSSTGGRRRR